MGSTCSHRGTALPAAGRRQTLRSGFSTSSHVKTTHFARGVATACTRPSLLCFQRRRSLVFGGRPRYCRATVRGDLKPGMLICRSTQQLGTMLAGQSPLHKALADARAQSPIVKNPGKDPMSPFASPRASVRSPRSLAANSPRAGPRTPRFATRERPLPFTVRERHVHRVGAAVAHAQSAGPRHRRSPRARRLVAKSARRGSTAGVDVPIPVGVDPERISHAVAVLFATPVRPQGSGRVGRGRRISGEGVVRQEPQPRVGVGFGPQSLAFAVGNP